MNIIQAIIIGVVQGLTEFLPVSSSAHLVFAHNILNVESSLAFDVFLHLGTLIAVLWYFRWDIIKMLKSWWLSIGDLLQGRFMQGFRDDPYKRLAWYVILATIPVGIVGVLFEDSVDALFAGALYVPAFFLFVTGTILYLSQRMPGGNINLHNITKKEGGTIDGAILASSNSKESISELKINFLVQKFVKLTVLSTSGSNLEPLQSLGIKKEFTLTSNDPNKKIVIKIKLHYTINGKETSKEFTIKNL